MQRRNVYVSSPLFHLHGSALLRFGLYSSCPFWLVKFTTLREYIYTDSTTNPTNNQIPDRQTDRQKGRKKIYDLMPGPAKARSIYHPTPTPWLSCGSSRGRTVEMPPEKKKAIYMSGVSTNSCTTASQKLPAAGSWVFCRVRFTACAGLPAGPGNARNATHAWTTTQWSPRRTSAVQAFHAQI